MGFRLGSLFIPRYGFFISVGIVVACAMGVFQTKLFQKDLGDFMILTAVACLGGIIGAKAFYFIVSWQNIDFSKMTDFSYVNSLMKSGFVFYGFFIGGALALRAGHKRLKLDVISYIRACIPCLPVAHAFGRLGCAAVGCCYGMPFDSAFSVVYHDSPFAPPGIPLFPVQLTEAVGNFMIAAILFVRVDVLKRERALVSYVFLYAPLRFVLEFFRGDAERGREGILSVSQWIGVALTVAAALSGTSAFRRIRELCAITSSAKRRGRDAGTGRVKKK